MPRFSRDARINNIDLAGTSWKRGNYLGRGAFATVHEAITNLGARFAVKEVYLSDRNGLMQLQKEIEIYRQYEHENIVRYLGTDKDREKLYLFLELMPSGSLETLYEKRSLTDLEVSTITRQILNVLVFLHDRNVIHRDIKCANILVGERGSVKLADFGLAKDTNLDAARSFVGTYLYMAPEVIMREDEASYGSAADIWSLGCTVLEMLTRKPPYPDSIEARVFLKIMGGEYPEVPNYLSEDAQKFIRRCLQANPSDRPTAAELLDDPFVGTYLYMAPEVIMREDEASYGLAADIWSLGCTVLEILTSNPPYPDSIEAGVLLKLTRGELPEVPNYLSENAKKFIRIWLRVNPIDRPSAGELLEDPFVN